MTFTQVSSHLYVGDMRDAMLFNVNRGDEPNLLVDVRSFFNPLNAVASECELKVQPLMDLAEALSLLTLSGVDVYLHCTAAMDRSPFVAALTKWCNGEAELDVCYFDVKSKHPQTVVHNEWLNAIDGSIT